MRALLPFLVLALCACVPGRVSSSRAGEPGHEGAESVPRPRPRVPFPPGTTVAREADRLLVDPPLAVAIDDGHLVAGSPSSLDALAVYLVLHPEITRVALRAHGSVDEPVGGHRPSHDRAQLVAEALASRGVASERLQPVGPGDAEPEADGSAARLELVVVAEDPARVAWRDEPGPGFHRGPAIDGSRAACLRPPFAPPPERLALDGGVTLEHPDERTWIAKIPGTRDASIEEQSALLSRLRTRDPELAFLGHGLYCGPRLCFQIQANLCEARVEDEIARFRAALAADGALADARLELAVELAGRVGPRCAPPDPTCVPTPYEGQPRYDPDGARRSGPLPRHGGGSCTHDGECLVGGCGNHCAHWTFGGAHEGATCEGYDLPDRTFCGCVEAACGWFTQ